MSRKTIYWPKTRKTVLITVVCTLMLINVSMYTKGSSLNASQLNNSEITLQPDNGQDEQVTIHFEPNATSLGAGQTVGVNITLKNTDIYPVYQLNATIDTTGFSNETVVQNMTVPIGTLSAAGEHTINVNFSLPPREAIEDEVKGSGLDLLFVIDGSGSMGPEIDAVKAQLTSLLDNLTLAYVDVRIGAIVYGWSQYSQYPADDARNYIHLSDDFSAARQFINALYAGGGIEPWGDALWLALNTMDWRTDPGTVRMIVQMGDEDCDPGNLVGAENIGGAFYNGSELFAVVDGLRTKEVKIFTVVTEAPHENVEEQFEWISKYTGGESFSLDKGGLTAEDLPRLINEWALNQTHEMIAEIQVSAVWKTQDGSLKATAASQIIWVDLTPPDISLSALVPYTTSDTAAMVVFANVKDISDVTKVTGFFKPQDALLWNFTQLEALGGSSYKLILPELPFNSKVQYYVKAWDSCGNEGSTEIINATVDYPSIAAGSITRVFAPNATVAYRMQLALTQQHIMWVSTINGSTDISLYAGQEEFSPENTTSQGLTTSMAWTQPGEGGPDILKLTPTVDGQNETAFLKITLAEIHSLNLSDPSLIARQFTMNESHQVDVFKVDVVIPSWEENLVEIWLTFPEDSALLARMRVYDDNWTLLESVADESGYGARFSQNGTYYLRIEREFREGNYGFSGEAVGYDPYRCYATDVKEGEDSAGSGWSFFLVIVTLIALFRVRKRKKKA
ncbi:MAG: vWA domain-containing protein [Candidatus Hodarchaeales archaeon]